MADVFAAQHPQRPRVRAGDACKPVICNHSVGSRRNRTGEGERHEDTLDAVRPVGAWNPGRRDGRAQDSLVVYSSVDEENAKKLLDAFTKATA